MIVAIHQDIYNDIDESNLEELDKYITRNIRDQFRINLRINLGKLELVKWETTLDTVSPNSSDIFESLRQSFPKRNGVLVVGLVSSSHEFIRDTKELGQGYLIGHYGYVRYPYFEKKKEFRRLLKNEGKESYKQKGSDSLEEYVETYLPIIEAKSLISHFVPTAVHEILHMLGLPHAIDSKNIMYSKAPVQKGLSFSLEEPYLFPLQVEMAQLVWQEFLFSDYKVTSAGQNSLFNRLFSNYKVTSAGQDYLFNRIAQKEEYFHLLNRSVEQGIIAQDEADSYKAHFSKKYMQAYEKVIEVIEIFALGGNNEDEKITLNFEDENKTLRDFLSSDTKSFYTEHLDESGVYIVRLVFEDGSVHTEKIIFTHE